VRALEVLAAVDLIACEDTRVTRKLLDRYGIATPLTSYHEHNAAQARPKLLARIADGAAIALVSDAGTPLVSDPGYKLVREARAAGANVTALPGASAVLAALTVSGLPTDRFLFEGFLPAKEAARRARIASSSAFRQRSFCSRPGHALQPRSPTSPPAWVRVRLRSAESSPNFMKKSGAAISRRSRTKLQTRPSHAVSW